MAFRIELFSWTVVFWKSNINTSGVMLGMYLKRESPHKLSPLEVCEPLIAGNRTNFALIYVCPIIWRCMS